MKKNRTDGHWDLAADIVVLGYGYAGGVAAIAAHDKGAKPVILEKADHPGGTSVLSGGGIVIADEVEPALRYLRRTNGGTAPEETLRAFCEGLVWLADYVQELGKICGPVFQFRRHHGGTYPFPGGETMGSLMVKDIPGFSGYSFARGLRGGARVFRIVEANVEARKVPVYYRTAGKRLITDGEGAVIGVEAESEGRAMRVLARRGVVLACGGFEYNEDMKRQFFEAQPVYGIGPPTNTGDGVTMAQKVGAALWHMWHFHGSHGFKFPDFPVAFRNCVNGPRVSTTKVQWILVDRYARRFMNEYPPAIQDTGIRPLEYYDADTQMYPRIPSYIILDDEARQLRPLAIPMPTHPDHVYDWSADNMAEVERGWIKRADTLAGLATLLTLPQVGLEETVARWNRSCDQAEDADFGRLSSTMMPVRKPPFYGAEQWPVVSNTQGGPVHNGRQQVMDVFGEPIPRLYAAGELGSIFGHLYLEAGNNAECFISGRIAGEHASLEPPWTDEALPRGEQLAS